MDKEVEEILSSSDDEDTEMDDFVPGVLNDDNDDGSESGSGLFLIFAKSVIWLIDAGSVNNAAYDDLAMSDSNSSGASNPPAKRCKLDPEGKIDHSIHYTDSSYLTASEEEDDDEWDDNAAALLDDQF